MLRRAVPADDSFRRRRQPFARLPFARSIAFCTLGRAGRAPHLTAVSCPPRRLRPSPRAARNEATKRRMAPPMAVLESRLLRDENFDRNAGRMSALVGELRTHLAAVRGGGGEEAVAKHRSRGKLTARERVDLLVDPGSDFLEFSALAAGGMYEGGSPSAGILTGIGIVDGQHCVIVANDA